MPLPAGIVTFLFTDIEGSTQLWEQYPASMPATLARHDTLLRQTIEGWGGEVFKMVGDAVYAVFASAPEAVEAAVEAQRALRIEVPGIRVRMALHTGEAEPRGDDYFGPALNRVARLLTAGHGGQVLLSRATAEQLWPPLQGEVDLRSLGEHRLRDIPAREGIFQLLAPGLPREFPPLNTLDVAFRRGMTRALAVSAVVLAVITGLFLTAVHEARIAREQWRENRRQRYVAEMNLAWDALKKRNFERLRFLLNAQWPKPGEEDLRGFEWGYLWKRSHADKLTLHTQAFSLQFLRDGKTLVMGQGRDIGYWDTATGRKLASYTNRSLHEVLTACVCSPDGRKIARAGWLWPPRSQTHRDWWVRVWDRITGREIVFRGSGCVIRDLLFSPDGRTLAGGTDQRSPRSAPGAVKLWNLITRKETIRRGPAGDIIHMAFSADGRLLAGGGSDGMVSIWSVTGTPEPVLQRAHSGKVLSLDFSPDGPMLAEGLGARTDATGASGQVRLWNLVTNREEQLPGYPTAASVAFGPDGKLLATAGADGAARLWDLRTKREVGRLEGHTGAVNDVVFSPDGQWSRAEGTGPLDCGTSRRCQRLISGGKLTVRSTRMPSHQTAGSWRCTTTMARSVCGRQSRSGRWPAATSAMRSTPRHRYRPPLRASLPMARCWRSTVAAVSTSGMCAHNGLLSSRNKRTASSPLPSTRTGG